MIIWKYEQLIAYYEHMFVKRALSLGSWGPILQPRTPLLQKRKQTHTHTKTPTKKYDL